MRVIQIKGFALAPTPKKYRAIECQICNHWHNRRSCPACGSFLLLGKYWSRHSAQSGAPLQVARGIRGLFHNRALDVKLNNFKLPKRMAKPSSVLIKVKH